MTTASTPTTDQVRAKHRHPHCPNEITAAAVEYLVRCHPVLAGLPTWEQAGCLAQWACEDAEDEHSRRWRSAMAAYAQAEHWAWTQDKSTRRAVGEAVASILAAEWSIDGYGRWTRR